MFNDEDDWLPLDECALRMGLTVDEVMDLVEQKALRARRWSGWQEADIEVIPAIISGAAVYRRGRR